MASNVLLELFATVCNLYTLIDREIRSGNVLYKPMAFAPDCLVDDHDYNRMWFQNDQEPRRQQDLCMVKDDLLHCMQSLNESLHNVEEVAVAA